MSVLLRSTEICKLPVVTVAGEDVAQIKDIVYAAHGGQVGGFTLNGRGMFAGPLSVALPWASVVGMGRDAVIIQDENVLTPIPTVLPEGVSAGPSADVLGSQVLTDDGTALGVVIDVVIEIIGGADTQADIVGYEIDPTEVSGPDSNRVIIPLPDTLTASGEHLVVPASARAFMTGVDLAGFGTAVNDFRTQLRGQS